MLENIKRFFNLHLDPSSDSKGSASSDERRRLAAAALMVELMQTDHKLDARETEEFLRVLQSTFELQDDAVSNLLNLAREEARQATSLYQFTRMINDLYSYDEKLQLIQNMWRIAFADAELDRYEDHLIRKIAELIHVSHSDFIRTKLQVRPAQD